MNDRKFHCKECGGKLVIRFGAMWQCKECDLRYWETADPKCLYSRKGNITQDEVKK